MTAENVDVKPVEGMEIQTGLLLAMLDDATQDWRRHLGEVSEDALCWQPAPNAHSIGAILLHIADVESHWLYAVATGQMRSEEEVRRLLSKETKQAIGEWPAPPRRPLAWYYAQHDEIRERTRHTIRELNNPEHIGTRREQGFTLRWLLHHVITHESYHFGQAVLLSLLYPKLAPQEPQK